MDFRIIENLFFIHAQFLFSAGLYCIFIYGALNVDHFREQKYL